VLPVRAGIYFRMEKLRDYITVHSLQGSINYLNAA
jgi:hypothetical protein